MKLTSKLLTIVLLIILTGCATQRRCNDKFPPVSSTNVKDSTVITYQTRYYDTTIYKVVEIPKYIVRDSVVIQYVNGVYYFKPLMLKGQYSTATVWVEKQTLKGQLEEGGWLPITLKLQMAEKTIKELRSQVSQTVTVKEVKYIPKYVKVFGWIGFGCVVLLLIYIGILVFVKYLKITINPL